MSENVLSRILFATPKYDEQQRISSYLDEKTAQIDLIIEAVNSQINNLKELRKTLINDVVTGKIKVVDNG
jgi:type I restriction enzyme S subunit